MPSAPSTPPRLPRRPQPAPRPAGLALAVACAAALLQACGSGDDDTPAPPPPPPAPAQVSGVVADGPLQGATACYDLNDNGACDTGEPSATTDTDGKYSFSVDAAAAGKHAVVAQVPATAIDKDTGAAIGAALVLVAPPSGSSGAQSVFVSPLTTVVAHTAADTGSTVAEAAARVQAQLELAVSPLADFTAAGANADLGTAARSVGKLMVDTAKLAADASVPADQAAKLVREAAITQLPVLAVALQTSAGTGATLAQRIAAAARAVSTQLNLSPTTVAAVAAAVSQPTVASDAAGPFVSVRRFAYTDANNYSYQIFTGDSSKTDAAGAWLANEPRASIVNGQAIAFSRNQLYWTGSDWNNCDNGFAVVKTVAQTATLPQRSTYCGGSKSESRVVWEDISGKTLREVITRMRAYPLRDTVGVTTDAAGLPVKWGPDPALLPADATFPAGSRYNTRRITNDIGSTDRIEIAVRPTVRYADGIFRQATTLEQLGLMPGNLAAADTVVSNQNSLFVEDETLASQPDAALLAIKRWRLAVDVAGLKGRFFRCDVTTAGNSQACEAKGEATLAVASQGGIRLLRVASGYPVALKDLFQRQRFWAEHVGTVFRGSTDLERSYSDQRLNKPAWDAVRTALGIPEPETPAAPVTAGAFNILRAFSFTDAANFSWRKLSGDNSQLDANGEYVISETRRTVSGGTDQPFSRNRTFWTGTAWTVCPDSGPIALNKAVSPFTSVYCGYQDERVAGLTVSLAGRVMRDVLLNDIRSWNQSDGGSAYSGWGLNPNVQTQLATARFPAGASMDLRGLQITVTPEGIATAATDQLRVAPSPTTTAAFATWPFAASLDDVIAKYPGNLLGSSTLNGNVTQFVHRYTETPTDAAYTDQVEIRVAFDANGQKARFFRNNRLVSNGTSTNYVQLLDTTYTIETLGGVRLLKFAAMPGDFVTRFNYERRFAERDGGVWFAFKDRLPTTPGWSMRLNETATNALFGALGIQ